MQPLCGDLLVLVDHSGLFRTRKTKILLKFTEIVVSNTTISVLFSLLLNNKSHSIAKEEAEEVGETVVLGLC